MISRGKNLLATQLKMRYASFLSSTAMRHTTNALQLGTMENSGAALGRMRLPTMWPVDGGTARKTVRHVWQEEKIKPASFLLPIGTVTPTHRVPERPATEMVLVMIPGAFLVVVNMQRIVRMITVQVYNICNAININMIEFQTKIMYYTFLL